MGKGAKNGLIFCRVILTTWSHESASKVQLELLLRSKTPDADATHFFMSKVLLEPVLGFSFEEFQFLENPQRKGKMAWKERKKGVGKEERKREEKFGLLFVYVLYEYIYIGWGLLIRIGWICLFWSGGLLGWVIRASRMLRLRRYYSWICFCFLGEGGCLGVYTGRILEVEDFLSRISLVD